MSKVSFVFVVTALAVVLTAAAVQAQQAEGGRRGRGRGGAGQGGGPMMMFMLLGNPKVRADLALSDEQQQDLMKLRGELRGGGDATPEERRTRIENFQKEFEKILKPEQLKRLKELLLQSNVAAALVGMPEFAKELAITPEQKPKLTAISVGMMGRTRGMSREERQEKIKEANKKALEVLTADQRGKLEKMQGKKLDMD
jgi:hypothetical protein